MSLSVEEHKYIQRQWNRWAIDTFCRSYDIVASSRVGGSSADIGQKCTEEVEQIVKITCKHANQIISLEVYREITRNVLLRCIAILENN